MQETAKLLIYSVCKKVMKLWCDWMCQSVAMILWVNICQGWHCWLQVAHISVLPTATYPWDYCCIWTLFFSFVCLYVAYFYAFVCLFVAGDAFVSFVYCLRSVHSFLVFFLIIRIISSMISWARVWFCLSQPQKMQIKSTRNKALDVECDISFSKHKNLSGQYCIVSRKLKST